MPRTIAIINHKGGVGKTTTTHNLGAALANLGYATLLVDLDSQANLTQISGIEKPERTILDSLQTGSPLPYYQIKENLFISPSSIELAEIEIDAHILGEANNLLKNSLEPVQNKFDYILIDCPPSLGILTINGLVAAREILIVVQSHYLSTQGLETILKLWQRLQRTANPFLKISGFLLTQMENTIISKTIGEQLRDAYGKTVFQTVVKKNVAFQEASSQHQDIFTYAPNNVAASFYTDLANEIIQQKA